MDEERSNLGLKTTKVDDIIMNLGLLGFVAIVWAGAFFIVCMAVR